MKIRKEKDFIGEKDIDSEKYWGIHTQRALENFNISNYRINCSLIKVIAMIKKACAVTNLELGYISKNKSDSILKAIDEIIAGELYSEFPTDALQGGAGTSINMNINEVIANRALEYLGKNKGDYNCIHPLDDINKHQSTNDVFPTAVKITAIYNFRKLSKSIEKLQDAFQQKEKEFSDIVKIGRTELQDAVPMTLGAEFSAFSDALSRDRWRTFKCEERLRIVNIGGTAIGTGLTAPRNYIFLVIEKLREITGLGISRGENIIDQTANADVFVEVSGILKAHASNLIKISNDLRTLNLLSEIKLPEVQAGSSIMAGKINPVILEAAIQVGIKVYANDFIISEAVSRGSLQINEFLPIIAHSLLESLDILNNIDLILAAHVLKITPNIKIVEKFFNNSIMIITAFLPHIGYDKTSELVKEIKLKGNENIREFLIEKLGADLVNKVLAPENITKMGYDNDANNS